MVASGVAWLYRLSGALAISAATPAPEAHSATAAAAIHQGLRDRDGEAASTGSCTPAASIPLRRRAVGCRVELVVNGKPFQSPQPVSLRGLIERMGLGTAICAAEVNKEVVPRREHEGRALRDGDRVEIVTLVGGG